jgi:S1-C subfamily serine protease
MKCTFIPGLVAALLAPTILAAQSPTPAAPPASAAPAVQAVPAVPAVPAVRPIPRTEAAQRELRAAQQELERASRRYAELTQDRYREDIERALHRPAFERPVIGIVMSADEGEGVRLAAVTPKSPAARAGLRSGDRLLRINGKTLQGADSLFRIDRARELIGELEDGEEVRLAYERAGQTREVTLKAESMPGMVWWRGEGETPEALQLQIEPMLAREFKWELGQIAPITGFCAEGGNCDFGEFAEALRWRGLRLAALEPKLGRYFGVDRGVLVLTSPGDELAGLEPGDVILRIDGEAVATPSDAMRLMRGKPPGTRIELEYLRERKAQKARLEAPTMPRLPIPPAPPAPPAPPPPPSMPVPAAAPVPPSAPVIATPPAPPSPAPPPPPPEDDGRGVLEQVWSY